MSNTESFQQNRKQSEENSKPIFISRDKKLCKSAFVKSFLLCCVAARSAIYYSQFCCQYFSLDSLDTRCAPRQLLYFLLLKAQKMVLDPTRFYSNPRQHNQSRSKNIDLGSLLRHAAHHSGRFDHVDAGSWTQWLRLTALLLSVRFV